MKNIGDWWWLVGMVSRQRQWLMVGGVVGVMGINLITTGCLKVAVGDWR